MNLVEAAQPIFEEVYKQKKDKITEAEKFRIERKALVTKYIQEKNEVSKRINQEIKDIRKKHIKQQSLLQKQQNKSLDKIDKEISTNEEALKRLLGPKHFQIERQKFLRGKRENDEKGLGSNNTGREVRTENSRGKDTKTDNGKM